MSETFLPNNLPDWLDYVTRQHWQSVDLGLSRMEIMVDRMALQSPARHVITVAGTNGKGTTCHALEGLILAAGCSVGTTLSPHIERFNERIRVAGSELSDEAICTAFAAVEEAREGLSLTYFEYSTLAALWTFRNADLDYAILEIGLGGRLDAFNVIDADTAIITSIGYDHQEFLGETLEEIGAEKAGILRRGQTVVLGADMPVTIPERAVALDLNPLSAGEDFRVVTDRSTSSWGIEASNSSLEVSGIPLGSCAPANIALAFVASREIGIFANESPQGIHLALSNVSRALVIRGRLEQIEWRDRLIICDVAHNPAGVEFLCNELELRSLSPDLLVCGMLTGKDHRGVGEVVSSRIDAPWILIDTVGDRALSASDLEEKMAVPAASCFAGSLQELGDAAISATEPGDVILVFGSFSAVEQIGHVVSPQSRQV